MKAALSKGPILPKYKKKFDAELTVYYDFGHCLHQGRVRLHGDWKDHIDFLEGGKFTQSLDVSLTNGTIANFTKFKLLLPSTRNGPNEIILTNLLRGLQFIAPKTSFVNVDVNTQASLMLIQEKTEKELLQGMNIKEGPLFEGDESYLFSNFDGYSHYELIDISLSKMTNSQWANASYGSADISLSAFNMLQRAYINFAAIAPKNNYSLDWSLLANGDQSLVSKWATYEILLFAAQASHGLIPHNRKFYFNTFYSGFEPIYWDGEPRSLLGEWMRIKPNFKYYPHLQESHFDDLLSQIQQIDIEDFVTLVGKENILDTPLAKKIINDISAKINILKDEFLLFHHTADTSLIDAGKFSKITVNNFLENLNSALPKSNYMTFFDNDNDNDNDNGSKEYFNANICSQNPTECLNQNISFAEVGNLLENKVLNLNNVSQRFFILPGSRNNIENIQSLVFALNTIQVRGSASASISFDPLQNILKIILNTPDDWVLIFNSNLKNTYIDVSSNFYIDSFIRPPEKEINNGGLPGCVSIFNSSFENTKIIAKHNSQSCEDTINIINGQGNISEINISNAMSDGLDIDFSNLHIKSLIVEQSGNDCADFSKGEYVLTYVNLSKCGDKAISIGEQSTVTIKKLLIDTSNVGIASKDSSVTSIQNSSLQNVDVCLDVYQKKQEYFGSSVHLNKFQCDSLNISKDIHSNISYHEF